MPALPNENQPTEKGRQTTLQGQKTPSDHKRSQKQAGQDLATDEAGGPLKEQTNQNKRQEQR